MRPAPQPASWELTIALVNFSATLLHLVEQLHWTFFKISSVQSEDQKWLRQIKNGGFRLITQL